MGFGRAVPTEKMNWIGVAHLPQVQYFQAGRSFWQAQVLELRLHEPRYALEPGERPVVSRLARLQAAKGELLTNLRHTSVRVPDESARQIIQRMDGTKDRNELARELERIPGAAANLDEILKDLTRLALLVRNG
jgi:hypothetical protein